MNEEKKPVNLPYYDVGDLVYYNPSHDNFYADGTKQLGIIVEIITENAPLYHNFPDKEYFAYEYRVRWINSGYESVLLGFNLKKLAVEDEPALNA